jgi:hypothetical protein
MLFFPEQGQQFFCLKENEVAKQITQDKAAYEIGRVLGLIDSESSVTASKHTCNQSQSTSETIKDILTVHDFYCTSLNALWIINLLSLPYSFA